MVMTAIGHLFDQEKQMSNIENKFKNMAGAMHELNVSIDELGDPEEAEKLRAKLAILTNTSKPSHSEETATNATESIMGPNPMIGLQGQDFVSVIKKITMGAIVHPKKTIGSMIDLGEDVAHILTGKSEIQPAKGDRRFSDNTWQSNPVYKGIMQSYLAWSSQLHKLTDELMDAEEDKIRARFMVSLITDAVAPSNTLMNPAAIKKIFETGGSSLIKGAEQLIGDIKNNGAMPSQVDSTAFEVGKNIACTEGAVIFRNEILELIQYTPKTENVYKRPVLFIPPQINKYYVLDLSPDNSLMKYLVEQGFQTFTICWHNPTLKHRALGFGDYVKAAIEAIDAVREITGETVNILGACSGGITSAVILAYLEAHKQREEKVNSLTMLVTMLDTRSDTELALFSTQQSVEKAKQHSQSQGFVDSSEMGRAFAWLRPNDLIWNYWVSNYLLGNSPPVFDILYWNADGTRMTAALHSDFLDIFAKNTIVNDGDFIVNDTPIQLSSIKCDYFSLAGTTDHITPWKTCYKSFNLLGGEGEFVLSNSGHIQSLVNPPTKPKANFYTNKETVVGADEWYGQAQHQQGSWWPYWVKWLAERSSSQVNAPVKLGSDIYPQLIDAPGTYIHE
jgi:polyhydroxyalkanoate synthase